MATTFKLTQDAIDPTLASLFASSSGPVKSSLPPRRSISSKLSEAQSEKDALNSNAHSAAEGAGEHHSHISNTSSTLNNVKHAVDTAQQRPRKRQRTTKDDDLEASYFRRLAREEARENEQQLLSNGQLAEKVISNDAVDQHAITSRDREVVTEELPHHESLDHDEEHRDEARAKRTVFLGNVSTEAIKSKTAKKALIRHLETVVNAKSKINDLAKIESLRFRSTAYAGSVGPKRAAFAKKELMEQTTKSTNAYAVFTAELAATKAVELLNGTMILDRHLKVDHVVSNSRIDHKRCIFVGNLAFVDEEIANENDGENKTELTNQQNSKGKVPADAEEGLWRAFGKVGTVESVRVIRDKETRVGKGFAYVQFTNENDVEAALLLNEKKFPPMLPRKLRVMRARPVSNRPKQGRSTTSQANNNGIKNGNDRRRFLRRNRDEPNRLSKSTPVTFEGHRASASVRDKSLHPRTRPKRASMNRTRRK